MKLDSSSRNRELVRPKSQHLVIGACRTRLRRQPHFLALMALVMCATATGVVGHQDRTPFSDRSRSFAVSLSLRIGHIVVPPELVDLMLRVRSAIDDQTTAPKHIAKRSG